MRGCLFPRRNITCKADVIVRSNVGCGVAGNMYSIQPKEEMYNMDTEGV